MTAIKNTLGKKERIKGDKRINSLFTQGESFISYPLRIVYCKRELSEDNPPVAMMVSVSKKKFKRAVKRNRIKRLVREAFRLNKKGFTGICHQYNTGIDIAFLYLKNELCDYGEIEKAMLKTITTLQNRMNTNEVNQ